MKSLISLTLVLAGGSVAAAPDYARHSSWAAKTVSAVVPKGATPLARRPAVDVFYVYPTTFRSKAVWNGDAADKATNEWTNASAIARQASVFNGCCRIYAPRYRQASMRTDKIGGRDRALDFAYGDVERAFDYYIKHWNRGRPFILAGHSQGGFMVARLLEKRVDGTVLRGRLVAAYIVGINLAEGDFGRRFRHVPICDTPSRTGCVVQWNSVLPTADLTAMAGLYEKPFVDKFGDIPAKKTLCVNPLTFDRGEPAASKDRSLGAVPGDPGEGAMSPLKPHAVSAKCEQGLLVVDPDPALGLSPLPGGSMHYHDFGLFYADVRKNVNLRVKAFGDK